MGRLLRPLKSNFTSGEIDPQLLIRTDIKHYYTGASYMGDVVVKSTGGFKRRPGIQFIKDLTDSIASDTAVKQVPFEFSADDTYELVFLDGKINVTKNRAVVHTITGTPWVDADLPGLGYTQTYDSLFIFCRRLQPYILLRITDTNWTFNPVVFPYIPYYDYSPVPSTNPSFVITPSGINDKINLVSNGSIFLPGDVGQKVELNGGLVRITTYTDGFHVSGIVEIPLTDSATTANGAWTIHRGFEPAWSATRGWPVRGAFHGGRLIMGGGPRPSTLWGSRVGDIYDFELLTGLDAEPIEVTLDNDGLNIICNIVSLRDLLVFTTGGEFVEKNNPITPNNFAPQRQSQRGSQLNTPVIEMEGAALFVQRKGKAIREFYFTNDQQAYTDDNLTLLASHLMQQPVSFVKRRASSTEENDLLWLVNADGTMRICSIVRSQEVVAWSRVTSMAKFISVGVDDEDVYVIAKIVIDGVTKYFYCLMNDDCVLDFSTRVTTGLPNATITAPQLKNTQVTIFADDSDMGEYTLNAGGVTTLQRTAKNYYEVGINFVPRVVCMPIEQDMPEGTTVSRKKRIVEATLQLNETTYIEVNGNRAAFRKFGLAGSNTPLDAPPPKFTGRVQVEGILGYKQVQELTLTQSRPGFLDLLGVALVVSF